MDLNNETETTPLQKISPLQKVINTIIDGQKITPLQKAALAFRSWIRDETKTLKNKKNSEFII